MDNFYMIVIIVAIIALIGVLTYVGIVMSKGESTEVYPPHSTTCPDYWELNEDKKCKIPKDGKKNTGSMYESGLLTDSVKTTIGFDEPQSVINFSHEDWKASGDPI